MTTKSSAQGFTARKGSAARQRATGPLVLHHYTKIHPKNHHPKKEIENRLSDDSITGRLKNNTKLIQQCIISQLPVWSQDTDVLNMTLPSSVGSDVIKPYRDRKHGVCTTWQVTPLTWWQAAAASQFAEGFPVGITKVCSGLASFLSFLFLLMSSPECSSFTKSVAFYSIPASANPGRHHLGVTVLCCYKDYATEEAVADQHLRSEGAPLRIFLLLLRGSSRLCFQTRLNISDAISCEDMTEPETTKWLPWARATGWRAKVQVPTLGNADTRYGFPI